MKVIDIYAVETGNRFELVDGPMKATHIARRVVGDDGVLLFASAFARLGDYEARGKLEIDLNTWLVENDPKYDPTSFRL